MLTRILNLLGNFFPLSALFTFFSSLQHSNLSLKHTKFYAQKIYHRITQTILSVTSCLDPLAPRCRRTQSFYVTTRLRTFNATLWVGKTKYWSQKFWNRKHPQFMSFDFIAFGSILALIVMPDIYYDIVLCAFYRIKKNDFIINRSSTSFMNKH